ncbi:Protein csh3 [Lecanora helva]
MRVLTSKTATSFFLGILFSLFPYDYPLLWTSSPCPPEAFQNLENHLTFLYNSPPIITRILHIVIGTGLLGFFIKLYRPSESNKLFDGASLMLYMCGVIIYLSNIVKGMKAINDGDYNTELVEGELAVGVNGGEAGKEAPLGRDDNLKVMAASNTILALVLVGVLVLQAGQWYAERKDEQEMDKARASKAANGEGREGGIGFEEGKRINSQSPQKSITMNQSKSRSVQRKTAEAVVAAFNDMDVEAILSHRNEQCMRTFLPTSMGLVPQDNATYYSSLKALKAIFKNFSLTINELVEDKEARRICLWLSAKADTMAGLYVNEYMWLLDFDSKGKISSSKEFSDSIMERDFFPKLKAAMVKQQAQTAGGRDANGRS